MESYQCDSTGSLGRNELSYLCAQVLHENRLLEQKISSVKELSVSVARWLVQGSAVEIRPLCRQAQPYGEVRACSKVAPILLYRGILIKTECCIQCNVAFCKCNIMRRILMQVVTSRPECSRCRTWHLPHMTASVRCGCRMQLLADIVTYNSPAGCRCGTRDASPE